MKKLRSALCLLALLLLIPAVLRARRILPLDTRPLVAEKYAGWTGVLNLWVYEGWPCGSASGWLNRCLSDFEKAHPGVYIQPQFVDAGAIASMNDSGILPPDMLLFPPDLLPTPRGLAPLPAPRHLRPALRRCGEWKGEIYAVPVAMSGYLWARNADRIDAIPEDWRDADAVLSVPTPQAWRRWDAALLALCSGQYTPDDPDRPGQASPSPPPEVALGLAGETTPSPTPSPEPQRGAALSRHLPRHFQFDGEAWRRFVNGEADATLVTQKEIRQLEALSEAGKGPRWQLSPGDSAFTDQLLSLAIVDRPAAAPRQALCGEFLAWLLSDECQSTLCRASLFAVTDIPSGYGASEPLAILDAALRDPGLRTPRIFDGQWTARAEDIVRKFMSDAGEAPALWARFGEYLAKKPND